jgi:hypothetical protein
VFRRALLPCQIDIPKSLFSGQRVAEVTKAGNQAR